MGSVRHLQTSLELTYTKRDTMAKFLGLFSLCLLLAVTEAKFFKKAKYAKKDEKLKCSTVIDEVSHEVCLTEYHDECKVKFVEKWETKCHIGPSKCETVWENKCHASTEKVCKDVEEHDCKVVKKTVCTETKKAEPKKWKRSITKLVEKVLKKTAVKKYKKEEK